MEKRPAKNQLVENGEELEKMSWTWGEGQAKPQDKDKWRRIILPFCTVPERMKKLSEWLSYCAQRLKGRSFTLTVDSSLLSCEFSVEFAI